MASRGRQPAVGEPPTSVGGGSWGLGGVETWGLGEGASRGCKPAVEQPASSPRWLPAPFGSIIMDSRWLPAPRLGAVWVSAIAGLCRDTKVYVD